MSCSFPCQYSTPNGSSWLRLAHEFRLTTVKIPVLILASMPAVRAKHSYDHVPALIQVRVKSWLLAFDTGLRDVPDYCAASTEQSDAYKLTGWPCEGTSCSQHRLLSELMGVSLLLGLLKPKTRLDKLSIRSVIGQCCEYGTADAPYSQHHRPLSKPLSVMLPDRGVTIVWGCQQ